MRLIQLTTLAASLFASGVLSHSWVECIKTNVRDKAGKEMNPSTMNDNEETCEGYPRNLPVRPKGQVMAPDWIWESSNYNYELNEFDSNGEAFACRANQRTPTYNTDAMPIAKASPGETILIRYWGNGHSTADPMYANPQGLDPGVVRIYWAGAPEKEIVYAKELNEANWIPGAQQAFEQGSIVEYRQDEAATPVKIGPNAGQKQKVMKEWGDYMAFTLPKDIQTGRHMMVWAWAWKHSGRYQGGDVGPKDGSLYNKNFQNTLTTCFDIEIVNGADSSSIAPSMLEQSKKADPAGEDVCAMECLIAGDPNNKCDPTKTACPACRVTGQGGVHCFGECNAWIKGKMCTNPTSAKFRRSSHTHKAHRRSLH